MCNLHERARGLHIVRWLRSTYLPIMLESVARPRQRLPPLQTRVRGDEGVEASSQCTQHVWVRLSLRLWRFIHIWASEATFHWLHPVHWTTKMSILPHKHQPNAEWVSVPCAEWLRRVRPPMPRLQFERLSDVLRFAAALAERGARMC